MFHSELSGKQQTGWSRSENAEYLCLYFLTVFGLVLVGRLLLALSLLCFDLFFVIFSFKWAEVAMDRRDTYATTPVGCRSKKLSQSQETWVWDPSAQKFLHAFRGHVQYFSFYSPSQLSTAVLVTKNIWEVINSLAHGAKIGSKIYCNQSPPSGGCPQICTECRSLNFYMVKRR